MYFFPIKTNKKFIYLCSSNPAWSISYINNLLCFYKFSTKCSMNLYKWEWCCMQKWMFAICHVLALLSPCVCYALRYLSTFTTDIYMIKVCSFTANFITWNWKLISLSLLISSIRSFFNLFNVFLMTHSNHSKMRIAAQMEKAAIGNLDRYSS